MVKKTEVELKAIANKICENITIREHKEYGSEDIKRPTTSKEKETMFNIVYGALFGFNWDNNTEEKGQAIADATEMIFDKFFPTANGYLSVYCPLKEAFKLWN